ncbi:MAG: hypothetical protein E7361_04040 [Clostridiales bacterium]|nr:hypothetical protein [Clostridiales bacterium]
MDIEALEFYKKQRTSLEKSFISDLNRMLEEDMAEWNELSQFKKSIYRHKYDTFINDTAKKLKEEITKLRALKKTDPMDIFASDVANIIQAEHSIPTCKNPFEWITKFRKNFIGMDCFIRVALFDRLDCKDMWDYDIIDEVMTSSRLELDTKEPFDQFNTLLHMVTNMVSKNTSPHKQMLDSMPEEDFLDTITGQISMNI